MNSLWYLLPAVACPLSMAALLWLMLRPDGRRSTPDGAAQLREVAAFRSQLAAWRPAAPDTQAEEVGTDR